MGRPRKKETNVTRILAAFNGNEYTTKELADAIGMKEGSVRSTVSFLTRAGLTTYGTVKGTAKAFRITEQGKRQLEVMQKE
jgi:predicted transcriptional regulator